MFNSNKLLQKVKNDYNKIAEHFSQTRQFSWPEFSDFKPYLREGQQVLDLGCGNGRLYFSFLKDFNLEYHGIDLSERLIDIANRESLIANRDLFPKFETGEMINLSYEDNYFDIVFCIATLHHLPSRKLRLQALREIKRVLKPGGYLLMTNWYWWDKFPWKYFFNNFWQKRSCKDLFIPWKNQKRETITKLYYYAFTEHELEKLIKDSGLKIINEFLKGEESVPGKKSRKNIVTICQSSQT